MYHPPLTKWKNPQQVKGLLFFSTAIIDLLFDYTIDVFKASALNTHSRALEFRALSAQLSGGRAQPGSLSPVVAELEYSVSDDASIPESQRSILLSLLKSVKHNLDKPDNNFINSIAEAIVHELDNSYWNNLLESIVEFTRTEVQKKSLFNLANSFVCELENRGLDRRHIFRVTKDFFFEGISPEFIESHSLIREYLSLFNVREKKFCVAFRASKRLLHYQDHASSLLLKVRDDIISDISCSDQCTAAEKDSFSKFISLPSQPSSATEVPQRIPCYVMTTVSAFDPYSARARAERLLQLLADVHSFEEHTGSLHWKGWVFVGDEDGKNGRIHRPRPNAMECGLQRRHSDQGTNDEAVLSLIDLIFGRPHSSRVANKLFTALEYHRSALVARRPETQLLDLWAMIEGLAPNPRGDTARITHYLRYFEAAVSLSYFERVARSVAEGIMTVDSNVAAMINDWTFGASDFEKVLKALCCEDLVTERKQIYAMLDHHPLMKWRAFVFHEKFSSPAKMATSISAHSRRVAWQLQRVYGLRNQIVHNSTTFPYITTIVENLHTYVDAVLQLLVALLRRAEASKSIDGLFELMPAYWATHFARIHKDSRNFSSHSFVDMSVGTTNPTSCFCTE